MTKKKDKKKPLSPLRQMAADARALVDKEKLTPPLPWSETWYESLTEAQLYAASERTQRRIAAGLQTVDSFRLE